MGHHCYKKMGKMARQLVEFFGAGGYKGYLGIAIMSLQAFAAINKGKVKPENIANYIEKNGEELTSGDIEKLYRFCGYEPPEQ